MTTPAAMNGQTLYTMRSVKSRSKMNLPKKKWMISLKLEAARQQILPTHLGENNYVFGIALWTKHSFERVSFLFFINPPLKARLVNPASGPSAFAWLYPQGRLIVFFGSKTHPTIAS